MTSPDGSEARIKELEAERDDALDRVEELERDAETVSEEFEKDCWIAVRRLLLQVGFNDFSEGVTADAACEIIADAITAAEARATALEQRLALAVGLARALLAQAVEATQASGCHFRGWTDLHTHAHLVLTQLTEER